MRSRSSRSDDIFRPFPDSPSPLNGTGLSEIADDTGNADNTVDEGGRGAMTIAGRRSHFTVFACAGCLMATGCVYRGGQSQTLDESGTPVGVTALSASLPKLV